MEFFPQTIARWLRTSVPGIIILGVAGSGIWFLLMWGVRKLKNEIIPRQRLRIFFLRLRRHYQDGYVLGYLSGNDNTEGLLAYFSHRICRTLIFALSSATCLVSSVILLSRPSGVLLTTTSYVFVVGTMVFAVMTYLEFWYIRLAFERKIPDLKERGEENFKEYVQDGKLTEAIKSTLEEEEA
jgi:hypothetical protein